MNWEGDLIWHGEDLMRSKIRTLLGRRMLDIPRDIDAINFRRSDHIFSDEDQKMFSAEIKALEKELEYLKDLDNKIDSIKMYPVLKLED